MLDTFVVDKIKMKERFGIYRHIFTCILPIKRYGLIQASVVMQGRSIWFRTPISFVIRYALKVCGYSLCCTAHHFV